LLDLQLHLHVGVLCYNGSVTPRTWKRRSHKILLVTKTVTETWLFATQTTTCRFHYICQIGHY